MIDASGARATSQEATELAMTGTSPADVYAPSYDFEGEGKRRRAVRKMRR